MKLSLLLVEICIKTIVHLILILLYICDHYTTDAVSLYYKSMDSNVRRLTAHILQSSFSKYTHLSVILIIPTKPKQTSITNCLFDDLTRTKFKQLSMKYTMHNFARTINSRSRFLGPYLWKWQSHLFRITTSANAKRLLFVAHAFFLIWIRWCISEDHLGIRFYSSRYGACT